MIEHNIITARNYAYIVIKQSPGYDAFVNASRIFVADPDFTPELHRLCDFSQADLSHISMSQMLAYAQYARENIPMTPTTRVALVAPGDDKMGIFRSFKDSINNGNFQLFHQPEDAVLWINTPQTIGDSAPV
ncbi:MAG: hypothetical protein KDI36_10070 [Pseudomonadales bacterium]|nr:hypothetical protein [Pseudomonadales bacterium]